VNEGIELGAWNCAMRSRCTAISSSGEISLRPKILQCFGDGGIKKVGHSGRKKGNGRIGIGQGEGRSEQNAAIKSVDDKIGSQENRTEHGSRLVFRRWRNRKEYS